MKKIIFLFLFVSSAHANDSNSLQGLVVGHYDLIGKSIGNNETYFGEVIINGTDSGSEMQVTRVINDSTVLGKATIELTNEKVHVLRIRFVENELSYEETCLINSDLDNYARLTCHVYEPDKTTKKPGLEALFIKQN